MLKLAASGATAVLLAFSLGLLPVEQAILARSSRGPSEHGLSVQSMQPAQPWRVVWTAGVESGATSEEFAKIRGGVIRADESALIVDEGMQVVRILASKSGKPTAIIGRPGSGPLEFRAPTTIRELSTNRYAVLDRMNGVMIFEMRNDTARQVQAIREAFSQSDMCVTASGIAMTGSDTVRPVTVFDANGRVTQSLGHTGMTNAVEKTSMGTHGSLACLTGAGDNRYAWSSYYRGMVRTFTSSGRMTRSDSVSDFKGYRASVQKTGVTFLPPKGGASVTATLLQLSDHVLLYQSLVVDRNADAEKVTSCVIDYRVAPGCRKLRAALPRLLHVRGNKALAVQDLPFPRVRLLEVDWVKLLSS